MVCWTSVRPRRCGCQLKDPECDEHELIGFIDPSPSIKSLGIHCDSSDRHLGGSRAFGTVSDIPLDGLDGILSNALTLSSGKYDEAYIDYLIGLLRKCKHHHFRVCELFLLLHCVSLA